MLIALLVALVAVNVAYMVLIDRKDKRHDAQLARLVVHVQSPVEAAAHSFGADPNIPLYLPPEDDQAWNDRHTGAAE